MVQDEERVMNAKDDDGEKTRVAIIMIKSTRRSKRGGARAEGRGNQAQVQHCLRLPQESMALPFQTQIGYLLWNLLTLKFGLYAQQPQACDKHMEHTSAVRILGGHSLEAISVEKREKA